jgi:transposase-like protein
MARAEKKTPTPHLRAVTPGDAPPAADSPGSAPAATGSVKAAPPVAASTSPAAKTPAPPVPGAPDPEVAPPRRRSFTAEFKRQVLAEADACTEPGEIGALLRRHGLYSSHLTEWRRQRDEGALSGLAPKKRGRKAAAKNPLAAEVARLERELAKANARAKRAEGLVELQKKLAALLGEEIPSEEELLEAQREGLPLPPWRKKGTR